MKRRASRRRLIVVASIVACLAQPAVTRAAPPVDQPVDPAMPSPAMPSPAMTVLIAEPASGVAAMQALGPNIQAAAVANEMTVEHLSTLLLNDPTTHIDTGGLLYFVDPAPPAPKAAAAPVVAAAAPFPYSQTFLLHSRPGSQRTIFLDFDGATVSGTSWNTNYNIATSHPGFDADGAPASFSNAEQDTIQSIWQRVAEDYAPFNIDVTTQPPAAAAITRANAADQIYGTAALITNSNDASTKLCGNGCGGIAYYNAFDNAVNHPSTQPAWIFPHMLGFTAKNIAETVTHEVGHNLGLSHDGPGYYAGHGAWAPIMGVGYGRPISQWSAGEYVGADNIQDDLAVMQSHGATPMADDHGNTAATATPLGGAGPFTGSGLISTRADKDMFSFTTTCAGLATFTVNPAPTSPDLDVKLRLLSSTGAELVAADPASAMTSVDVASGVAATAATQLATGSYRIEVDGTGVGNPLDTGYSDYASLGNYSVSGTVCGAVVVPPNDTFSNTIVVTGAGATFSGTNVGATAQTSEPGGSGAQNTVWWRWTAPSAGTATFHTTGSAFDTYLCVYTGSPVTALTSLGCNNDINGTPQSAVSVAVTAGTTYQIQVDGAAAATGSIAGGVTVVPANDAFGQATTIATGATVASDNTGATGQIGELGGSGALQTLWWKWTAPSAGTLTVDTAGSTVDTYLCVQTGAAVGATTLVGCNDDGGGLLAALVTVPTASGTTYLFQVDGYNSNTGALALHVAFAPQQNQPVCNGAPVTVDLTKGQVPTTGNDVVWGGAGNETIDGLAGNDTICGNGGGDTLLGGIGNDKLFGGAGIDLLNGGAGTDVCNGGAGIDTVAGGCETRVSI